ncbi:hypothetical protein F4809DRAFT_603613 [Biscogniauxia mediterranea]|nr:hypothetical protein F4809DRAFT_603613 [Biscogniauxia mediterranea]
MLLIICMRYTLVRTVSPLFMALLRLSSGLSQSHPDLVERDCQCFRLHENRELTIAHRIASTALALRVPWPTFNVTSTRERLVWYF